MSNPLADQLYGALNRYSRKEEAMVSNNLIGRRAEFKPFKGHEALEGPILAVYSDGGEVFVCIDISGDLEISKVSEGEFTLLPDAERLD